MKKTETEQTATKTPAPTKTDNVRISNIALTLAIALINGWCPDSASCWIIRAYPISGLGSFSPC